MSLQGVGVDIVQLDRMNINNKTFIKRILSKNEMELFNSFSSDRRKLEFLGGRFAAKEAYLKAKHLGLGGIDFRKIEILNHSDGVPYLNDEKAHISISHEHDYVVAFVVIDE